MDSLASKKKTTWSRGDKALIIGTGLVVAIVVAITLWYKTINTLPKVIVPTPSMSSQNAFDHFLAAGNAAIDSKKIGFAFTKNHASDSHNPDDRDYSLAEKQSLVAENAGALRALRVGLTYSYQNPPYDHSVLNFHITRSFADWHGCWCSKMKPKREKAIGMGPSMPIWMRFKWGK